MRIGDMRERVKFLRKDQVRQPDGKLKTTLVEIASCWGSIKPKSGNQRNMAQQTENPADFEVTVRSTPETRKVRGKDILEWRGEHMNITWAPPSSPRDRLLHMDAKAGVAV